MLEFPNFPLTCTVNLSPDKFLIWLGTPYDILHSCLLLSYDENKLFFFELLILKFNDKRQSLIPYIHIRYASWSILIKGANLKLAREQGDTKSDLGSTKIYLGEHQENNSGSGEKRVKFQSEPGAGDPPYRVSLIMGEMAPYLEPKWLP